MRLHTFAALTFAGLGLAACGGGGGGSVGGDGGTGPAPTEAVDVSRVTRPDPGTSISFSLSGEASQGGPPVSADAVLTIAAASGTDTFNQEEALPIVHTMTIQLPDQNPTSLRTVFVAPGNGERLGSRTVNNVVCFADTAEPPPAEVTADESGTLFEEVCMDDSTRTGKWRTEAGDDTLDLIFTVTSTQGGRTTEEVRRWRFDEEGTPQSLKIEGELPTDNGMMLPVELDSRASPDDS